MRNLAKRLLTLLLIGLMAASCTPAGGQGGGRDDVRPNLVMDQDRNKIFDSLDRLLAQVGDKEMLPVLVMASQQADLEELENSVGPMQVKYRYSVVPAMAISATKDQVSMMARQTYVRHIEYDAEVRIAMDGASRWFGAQKARQDYGVTGDRDGSPNSYSRNDVVVAVIDTGIAPSYRT